MANRSLQMWNVFLVWVLSPLACSPSGLRALFCGNGSTVVGTAVPEAGRDGSATAGYAVQLGMRKRPRNVFAKNIRGLDRITWVHFIINTEVRSLSARK